MSPRKRERAEQRAHRHDREIAAATWRREQARAGRAYRFELPPSLRRGQA
jgi:hypothetical protein